MWHRGFEHTYGFLETIWLKHRMLMSRLSAYSLEMHLPMLSESTKLLKVCSIRPLETNNSTEHSIWIVSIQLNSCNEFLKQTVQQSQGRTRRTSLFWPERIFNT